MASLLIPPQPNIQSRTPFDDLIPSNRFDLFWTMWNTDPVTFRDRHLLVLESVFVHHPHATIFMFSSTLNDTKLFLPFRDRGYRIHSFNISLRHMLQWNWYLNNQTQHFLQHWNSSSTYFYTHLSDYFRTIVLYLYGGTYMDMDALILQPLPDEEFIGYDQTDGGGKCRLCVRNKSDLYLAPGFMRFQPNRRILRQILERSFDRRVYIESCFECVGPTSYTKHIRQYRDRNDPEMVNLRLLEPHRLYPFSWAKSLPIFQNVEDDTSLELADLMKRSYSIHLFGHMSGKFGITPGSLIDLLFHRFDLGGLQAKIAYRNQSNNDIRLIYSSLYIDTGRKKGRFLGRDAIYLRLNQTLANENIRWNIAIHVSNGRIVLPYKTLLFNRNQAQINMILNKMSYEPFESTSTDTLIIELESERVSLRCSLRILIFSRWVTVLTKMIGTPDRWPMMQRLIASVEKYFPQTKIHIASDSGKDINKIALLNFTSSDNIKGYDLIKTLFIHNVPEDSGLTTCCNYLVNITSTPFFFLFDGDFELEEDSHLDLLLELVYTHRDVDIITGKTFEALKSFHDYSGLFLRFNQTLNLEHNIQNDPKNKVLFSRSSNKKTNKKNPCRQVDIVPNMFMGRTESVRSIRWNDNLKVGGHEDFFVRFGKANRTVYICRHIHVHHHRIPQEQAPKS